MDIANEESGVRSQNTERTKNKRTREQENNGRDALLGRLAIL
jgi:hypothetical protein